jgi:hypothetical protein
MLPVDKLKKKDYIFLKRGEMNLYVVIYYKNTKPRKTASYHSVLEALYSAYRWHKSGNNHSAHITSVPLLGGAQSGL